jgi:dihydrodipicolinate synthase/N-acetylneuraminate lyase
MAMMTPDLPAISPADIRGALAILPTPSVPNADHWSCAQSVNLDETARMVARMRAAGLDTFITAGSFGEGLSPL